MRTIVSLIVLAFALTQVHAQGSSENFKFKFEGVELDGVLSLPRDSVKGLVLIVHGSGRTNAVAQNMYADVRQTLQKSGYATYMWDKMGCGKSGGTFNYNQTVQSSAAEVLAAIHALQQKGILGASKIGLWGISRAGWIIPLVINQYKDIEFWISVSGVDAKESFHYLFKENLRINGHPEDSVELLVGELKEGARLSHAGASFESYMKATRNLQENAFWKRFNNNPSYTAEGYYAFQKSFMKEAFDEANGLQVYIRGFDSLLSNIHCPVLALFGETDMNVDWKKTKSLYKKTLGLHTDLTIQSFPNCNHNLFRCETGAFYEFQDNDLPWDRCEGFLEEMSNWLNERE